ncbi:MAG: FAD-dependent oxidoreductase [Ruminococcaceae bacterium]|nr:FAD-dependent oxidoreductase [Oscillospiraceae bacterium]
MNSIWKENCDIPVFPAIDKDISTDVLIIGGGICGILCAYMLQKNNIDYVLVEAERICSKTTANTTAKITSQHGMIYGKISKNLGIDAARLYYEANENAIKKFKYLCKDIDCNFKETDSYVFTLNDKEKIEKEYSYLREIGIDAELIYDFDIPFDAKCGIKFKKQASFNPLKFISAICKNLIIYENSRVGEMIGTQAIVNGHKISANKVIVATHFPFINKHGLYFLKMYQHRSYALALKSDYDLNGMYVNDTKYGLSLRRYGEYIILGGEGHRTGKKSEAWQGLERLANKYFPGDKIVYKWATQDCMTLDGIPYIGNYSRCTPDLYVATGFNKWGMTSSMVAAELLCDLIMGKDNKYKDLFSPSRSMLKPQLAINTLEALGGWLSFTKKRCPHLGCALKWNKFEHSWDCACHGSRFKENGDLLDGPANNSLNDKL